MSAPVGINTEFDRYHASFDVGTVVRLTAEAEVGSTFAGFRFPADRSRACEAGSSDRTCRIELDGPVVVEAVFDRNETVLEPEQLTVELDGDGSGSVTSRPTGIDTSVGDFAATFERGSPVRLDAVADAGSRFVGFDFPNDPGLECGSNDVHSTCLVVLEGATTVSATFELLDEIELGDRFDLVASVPVAGGEFEIRLPDGAGLVFVRPHTEDTFVEWSVSGGSARVVWLSRRASSGPQLQLALDEALAWESVEVRALQAFESAGAQPIDADEVRWLEADGATIPPPRLPSLPELDATAELSASFADHPLGDVQPDGVLDVRDAMRVLELLDAGEASGFERYHADINGDGVIDARDLRLLLERLIDPALPARLIVKATSLSFVRLDPATDHEALILLGNRGREAFSAADLRWEVPAGVEVDPVGGIDGQSLALRLALPEGARKGWLPGEARISGPGVEATYRVGHLVLLIAGQSNASGRGEWLTDWPHAGIDAVRMLGNDYLWRNASEPLDDASGQVDSISVDANARYSFGTRLGELLVDATGFETYLIPAAKGGSSVTEWLPSAPLSRSTLYGSAHFRALVSAALRTNPVGSQPHPSEGGPVSAVIWYQGESDDTASQRNAFVRRTDEIMDAFDRDLGVPVVYVQLASNGSLEKNRQQHEIAELQRRMETGSGHPVARAVGSHLVVSFDLPRSDRIHLSAYAQRVLAERIELAFRQHVLGEGVDGTGPRLVSISHVPGSTTVRLHATQPLASGQLDLGLFTVFDGDPGDIFQAGYGADQLAVTAAVRDPSDSAAVRLTLASAPSSTPYVRYMRPPGPPNVDNRTPSDPELWDVVHMGVIRSADSDLQYPLPLPAFGPLPPF